MYWLHPPINSFKLNVDTSIFTHLDFFRVSAVIRNDLGLPVVALAKVCRGSVFMDVAEAIAVLEGVLLVVERNLFPLFIEYVSLSMVQLCRGEVLSKAVVGTVDQEILTCLADRIDVFMSFIPKTCNVVAHTIVYKARSCFLSSVLDGDFPG
ncbi:hypothetical protein ACOSP7_021561 [Xanthoceras sorbifolium]